MTLSQEEFSCPSTISYDTTSRMRVFDKPALPSWWLLVGPDDSQLPAQSFHSGAVEQTP